MDPTRYQRIRLWAGITSIGANLALIWGLAISASWWASGLTRPLLIPALLLAVAVIVTLANFPFDLLTGDAVERAADRSERPTSGWIGDWIRNRTLTMTGLWVGMMFFSFSSQVSREWVALEMVVAGIMIATLLLLVPAGKPASSGSPEERFERPLASELKTMGIYLRRVRWFDHGDSETVNGCITPRGILSLSTTVARWLTPREAALVIAREECYRQSGAWIVILLVVAVWTLLGILLAFLIPSVNPVQAGLCGAAVMSSWCLLALFVWPAVNRIWVNKADLSLASLASPVETRDLIAKIERLNATDISLSPAKTAVFHPIPPLQERLSKLDRLS